MPVNKSRKGGNFETNNQPWFTCVSCGHAPIYTLKIIYIVAVRNIQMNGEGLHLYTQHTHNTQNCYLYNHNLSFLLLLGVFCTNTNAEQPFIYTNIFIYVLEKGTYMERNRGCRNCCNKIPIMLHTQCSLLHIYEYYVQMYNRVIIDMVHLMVLS